MKYLLLLPLLLVAPLSADMKRDVKCLKESSEYFEESLGALAQQMYYLQIQSEEQAKRIHDLEIKLEVLLVKQSHCS